MRVYNFDLERIECVMDWYVEFLIKLQVVIKDATSGHNERVAADSHEDVLEVGEVLDGLHFDHYLS